MEMVFLNVAMISGIMMFSLVVNEIFMYQKLLTVY